MVKQHRLGFADPALYEIDAADSSAFNDITDGSNDLSGKSGGLSPATTGYDMASGLGSPYGPELIPELADTGVQLLPTIAAKGAPFSTGHNATWTVHVTNTGTKATTGTVAVGISVDDGSLGNIGWTATGTGWTCSQGQCATSAIVPAAQALPALKVTAPLSSAAGGEV